MTDLKYVELNVTFTADREVKRMMKIVSCGYVYQVLWDLWIIGFPVVCSNFIVLGEKVVAC